MLKVKSCLKTTIILIAFLLMTGCASNLPPDEYATVEPSCPRDLKRQGVERRGQVTKCSCVTPGEMEQMLEHLTNMEIQ